MASIDWDLVAIDDLELLRLKAARNSARNAENLVSNITTAVARLADFPLSGRIVPEYNRPELRELIVGRTRVLYQVLPDGVRIVMVKDGSRPLTPRDYPL